MIVTLPLTKLHTARAFVDIGSSKTLEVTGG